MSVIKVGQSMAVGYSQVNTSNPRYEGMLPMEAKGRYLLTGTPGDTSTLRAAAVMTGSYVASTKLDLYQFNNVAISIVIGTTNSETASVKYQWSDDDSTYYDELVLVAGAAGGGEQPYTYNAKVISVSCSSTANSYSETVSRKRRYLKVAVKSTGTTATVSIVATPINN